MFSQRGKWNVQGLMAIFLAIFAIAGFLPTAALADAGDTCINSSDCTGGTCSDPAIRCYCDMSAPVGGVGECAERGSAGEVCPIYESCRSGLICTDGICRAPAPVTVGEGEFCTHSGQCTEGVCGDPAIGCYCGSEAAGGGCVRKGSAGTSCVGSQVQSGNASEICRSGLACESGTCAVATAAGDNCGVTTDAVKQAEVDRKATAIGGIDRNSFSCQRVPSGKKSTTDRCVSGLCASYSSSEVRCCAPGTGSAPGAPDRAGGGGTGTGSGGGLELPRCTDDGSCGLDEIVQTGVNFANFLFGISGAIFLAIFVYAGFKYIFYSSNSGEISKAKTMLVNATVGMILIIGAGILVNFVYQAVLSTGGGDGGAAENTCERNHAGFTCVPLSSDATVRSREITERRCVRNQCLASPDNVVCCPSAAASSP